MAYPTTGSLLNDILYSKGCRILRYPQPKNNPKWGRKYQEFCSKVLLLSSRIEQGEYIDAASHESVLQRIDKIASNCLDSCQLMKVRNQFLRAGLECLNPRFKYSYQHTPCFAFSDRGGVCGWFVRALALQNTLNWTSFPFLTVSSPNQTCVQDLSPKSSVLVDSQQALTEASKIEEHLSTQQNPVESFHDDDIRDVIPERSVHKKEEPSSPTIIDQDHLQGVVPGSWVFFRHMNRLTHVIIDAGQRLFSGGISSQTSRLIKNVTHVGLVTYVFGRKFQTVEIPEYGKPVTMAEYNIDRMDEPATLLFVSPQQMVSSAAIYRVISGMRLFQLTNRSSAQINQYDAIGAGVSVIQSLIFYEQDKIELIDHFVDYLYGLRTSVSKNKYFCSKFVMLFSQIGRLQEYYSQVSQIILQEVNRNFPDDPQQRSIIVKKIVDRLNKMHFWDLLAKDPIFRLPARAATPAQMINLVLDHHLPIIRVPVFIASNHTIRDHTEFLAVQLFVKISEGRSISINDTEIQSFIMILERETGLSRQTWQCWLEKCLMSKGNNCVESCLEETLTVKEKLIVFITAKIVNKLVNNLLTNSDVECLIHELSVDRIRAIVSIIFDSSRDEIIEYLLPLSFSSPIKTIQNYLIRWSIQAIDRRAIFKYLPLALGYDFPKEPFVLFKEKVARRLLDFIPFTGEAGSSEEVGIIEL